jgi:hypothetical protein
LINVSSHSANSIKNYREFGICITLNENIDMFDNKYKIVVEDAVDFVLNHFQEPNFQEKL